MYSRQWESILFKRGSYNKCHIARSTGHVQDLCALVGDPLQQELLHQGLWIPVSHDRLALIEVLQVLIEKP